jgi:hypothetical protein
MTSFTLRRLALTVNPGTSYAVIRKENAGLPKGLLFKRSINSNPVISGITMSVIKISTASFLACSSASLPLVAEATFTWVPNCEMARAVRVIVYDEDFDGRVYRGKSAWVHCPNFL